MGFTLDKNIVVGKSMVGKLSLQYISIYLRWDLSIFTCQGLLRPGKLNVGSLQKSQFLKFNVDGSSLGCPRKSGIGGVLKNHRRQVMGYFSKATGDLWAYEAKVQTILQTLMQPTI